MIRPQFSLDLNGELFVDNFAGGGGASTGIERAIGRHVDHAINHNREALGMHRMNHPQTVHHCEDVFEVDPVKLTAGRPVGGGWFSPDCKHFSKAKGGKPLSKKIRGLAFVILRWAQIRTRVIYMENVEEIQTWGPLTEDLKPDARHKGRTWRAFLRALGSGLEADCPDMAEMLEVLNGDPEDPERVVMSQPITAADLVRGFGYEVDTREIRACDFGSPTIRKRLFLIARCDGLPIVWPEVTHVNPKKKGTPATTKKLKPWRMVAECIDWSLRCNSIFLNATQAKAAGCRRPLAASTLRRIATGIDRYVLKEKRPFLVSLTHQGGDRVQSVDEPVRTLTGAHRGEKAVVQPKISRAQLDRMAEENTANWEKHGYPKSEKVLPSKMAPFVTEHANASNQRNMPADEPMRTACAGVKGGHFAVVTSQVVGCGGRAAQSRPRNTNEPLQTLTAKADSCLVTGVLVGVGGPEGSARPKAVDVPYNSVLAQNHTHLAAASLVKLRGTNVGQAVDEPGHTISAGGTHLGMVAASLIHTAHGDADKNGKKRGRGAKAITEPLPSVTGSPDCGIAAATLVREFGQSVGQGIDQPAPTVMPGGGGKTSIATAYLAQHNGGFNTTPGHVADKPISTINASGSQQQVVLGSLAAYYGNDVDGQAVTEPCRTVTTMERFGFVESQAVAPMSEEQIAGARQVAAFLRGHGISFEGEFATVCGFVIVDIGMRMLTPRELFRAQGFPEDYVIDRAWVIDPKNGETTEVRLTKEQQIRMCGNSVCPQVAEALVRANSADMVLPHGSPSKRRAKAGLESPNVVSYV